MYKGKVLEVTTCCAHSEIANDQNDASHQSLIKTIERSHGDISVDHDVYLILWLARTLRGARVQTELTSKERDVAIDAADRFAASAAVGMIINLALLQHFGTAVAREKHHG